MRIAVLLLGYPGTLGALAPVLLPRAGWVSRSPRLGIWAWQTLTVTVVLSVALAGLAVAVPTMSVTGGLADMLHACVLALRAQYAAPGGAVLGATGAVLALMCLGRVAWCLAASLTRARRDRSRHAAALRLVAGTAPISG